MPFCMPDRATDAMTLATCGKWADRITITMPLRHPELRHLFATTMFKANGLFETAETGDAGAWPRAKYLPLAVDDTFANAALLEQGTTKRRRVWLIADGQLHGGNSGYLMDLTYTGRIIPGARTEKQTIQIILKYEGKQTAPITSVVPIFS